MKREAGPSRDEGPKVWVFEGHDVPLRPAYHPSAVFSSLQRAEEWIKAHALSGLLTTYVLDEPAFDRSLRRGTVPLHQRDGALRQVWAGGEEHWHYENGVQVG